MSFQTKMNLRNFIILILFLVAGVAANGGGKGVTLTGDDFSQWQDNTGQWQIVGDVFMKPDNNKLLSSKPGTGVILNGPTGRTSNLLSKAEFGDVKAHIEFMVPKGSNSGVYFNGRYEIQVLDSWGVKNLKHGDCGGIYQRWDDKRKEKGYEGRPPRVNASREAGQWQTFEVIFRAPRFNRRGQKISNARFEKVVHNGTIVHADVEVTGPTRASAYNDEKPTGPLMLQGDHGPVAYRNIRIEPAGPNPFFVFDNGIKDDKHKTAKEQIEMVKELGYEGIAGRADETLGGFLEELDKNSLSMVAVYLGANIDADQQAYGPELKEAIELLKGRNTILWLYMQSKKLKPSTVEGDPRAVEIVQEIADMAAENGLRVALYPHASFWLEKVEDGIRVAKKVDRKNVGVTFNLCHWLRTEDENNMRSLINSAMPNLFIVSINGADSGGEDWKTLIQTLDRGNFNMRRFLRTLNRAGYNGPIGLQCYGIGGDAYDNLKRSMDAWIELNNPRR
jgi:sugar phosphate isomerase/epimerase